MLGGLEGRVRGMVARAIVRLVDLAGRARPGIARLADRVAQVFVPTVLLRVVTLLVMMSLEFLRESSSD